MLMHFDKVKEVSLLEVFTTLCNFSYNGDIRMRWKMENPEKVKNLVKGSYDGLLELYMPLVLQL